ncbi:MAG: hypothetical protein NTV86_11435 [Planctomycetota bacterium]|nr:hypothetical protein [Planctomycetota bacterium]
MHHRMILAAGVFGVMSVLTTAGAQETQPAPASFRSDVRMGVYVYDDDSSPARELGRMPAASPIEIPVGREWEVSLSAADFAAAKDALVAQLTELGRRKLCPTVGLTDGATDADVEALAKVEGLTALAVDAGKITDKALARMATMSGLREIRLTWCRRLTPGGVAALGALPALSRLSVDGCAGMSNDLAAKLRAFPALKNLTLSGEALDARCLGDLGELKALESLHLLDARWLRDEHMAKIAQMKALTELNLAGCNGLRGPGLAALAALPPLKTFAGSRWRNSPRCAACGCRTARD